MYMYYVHTYMTSYKDGYTEAREKKACKMFWFGSGANAKALPSSMGESKARTLIDHYTALVAGLLV